VGHLLAQYMPHVVEGRVEGFIATATDITEVEEARLLADEIFLVSPVAKFIVGQQGRIVRGNPAAARLTGYPEAQLVGLELAQLLPPHLRQRHALLQQAFLASPSGNRRPMGGGRTFALLRADGSPVDVEIELSQVKVEGQPAAIVCVREVAMSPHALHKMDLALQARNAFLAQVSHEIRTPLNAILGMAQLLEVESPTPKQLDRLHRIEDASNLLLGIVDDVLDLSRLEAGRLKLEPETFALAPLVERGLALVAEKARVKGLTLKTDLAAGLPSPLVGDARRIEQILVNLLSNAVKFTHTGGIEVRVSALPASDRRVMLRMEVVDTGIGIAAEDLAQLFTPFRQVEQGHSRRYGGTGLGLSISRQLARAMQGDCGAFSTPGLGSTFWFQVLLERSADEAPSAPAPSWVGNAAAGVIEAERLAQHTVLVVEDNEINRIVIHELLESSLGVTILEAEDGEQALALAAQHPPVDLVLMDIQMPGIDGLETTRRLRQLPGYADAPIYALTANVHADDVNACLAAGMNGHLAKPILLEDLLAVIHRLWA
jgi:PAS domain S-box-containing protein